MANVVEARVGERVSWGALFASVFVTAAVWMLLMLLGTAVGFSSFDPRSGGAWASLGKGVGIWGGIAAILSVFAGGWLASRLSASLSRALGVLHGVALWGFAFCVGLWLAFGLVTSVVGGAAQVAGTAAQAAGAGLAQVAPQVFDSGALATQANAWLQSQGKPAVPPAQLEAAFSDVETRALGNLQKGEPIGQAVSPQMIADALTRNTSLSRTDAAEVAAQIQAQAQSAVDSAQKALAGLGQTAQRAGVGAVQGIRAASWGGFAVAVLTLIAAALGGLLGVRRVRHDRPLGTPATVVQPGVSRPLTPQEA